MTRRTRRAASRASGPGGSSTRRSTRWSCSSRPADVVARPASAVSARAGAALALGLGALAIVGATVVGTNADVLEAVVTPPPLIRAALVGGGVALGLMLFARSVGRLSESGTDDVP